MNERKMKKERKLERKKKRKKERKKKKQGMNSLTSFSKLSSQIVHH